MYKCLILANLSFIQNRWILESNKGLSVYINIHSSTKKDFLSQRKLVYNFLD